MITEDYVSFETAKLLKEKGFDSDEVGCHGGFYSERCYESGHGITTQSGQEVGIVYDDLTNSDLDYDEYLRPTLQMAMKWLREVHNIDIVIDAAVGMLGVKVYVPFISTYKPLKDEPSKVHQIKRGICYKDDKGIIPALQQFDSYEEAIEAAIKYCLDHLIVK